MRILRGCFWRCSVLCLFLFAITAHAQTMTVLRGSVTTVSGAAIAGATVTATNLNTKDNLNGGSR